MVTVSDGVTLTLNGVTINGTTINDGNMANTGVAAGGTIAVTGSSKLDQGTTITDGAVAVSAATVLTLDDVTVTNTTITDANATTSVIAVDNGQTLTLSGVTINDGTINDGTVANTAGGTIDVTGNSTIDSGATLNDGVVTVSDGVTLTLNGVTINGTTINDGNMANTGVAAGGTIAVTGSSKLDQGTTITDGAVAVSAATVLTLDDVTVTNTTITDANATTSVIAVDNGQTLTLSGVTINDGTINDGTVANTAGGTIDVTGNSTIDSGATLNDGVVTVSDGVTLTLNGVTINGTTINDGNMANTGVAAGGTIAVTGSSKLDQGTTITDGAVAVSAATVLTLDDVTVTNTTITDANATTSVIAVDNGQTLTLSGVTINDGTIKLNGATAATKLVIGNTVTLDDGGTVLLTAYSGNSIVSNGAAATLDNYDLISGVGTIGDSNLTLVNDGTIEALGGTLEIVPDISGTGALEIAGGATLQLDGSTPEVINFLTGTDILVLNDASGAAATVDAQSTASGTFTIQGSGIVSTTSGDGIDFTASGGTTLNPAVINIDTGGSITGAASGIVVTQDGTGNVTVDPSAAVTGNAGNGIAVTIGTANGFGNILIDGTGNVTGTGSGHNGIVAQITNKNDSGTITVSESGNVSGGQDGIDAIDGATPGGTVQAAGSGNVTVSTGNNATITGTGRYGINATTGGTGSISVTTTGSGTTINSGGAGISAVNQAPASVNTFAGANSTISVTATGTITSGATNNNAGTSNVTEPSGIQAGYQSSNAIGDVTVDNFANINAMAGDGINAFTKGTGTSVDDGDIKVTDEANTTIKALHAATGVTAGNPSNPVGIQATSSGTGSITIITSAGDLINAGSDGILAKNDASTIASALNSTISVTAYGTVESGNIANKDGSLPAGILASYGGGSTNTPQSSGLYGNITINNYATIIATDGDGIRASNFGIGNINITDEAPTVPGATTLEIEAAAGAYLRYGINAENFESGNITIATTAGDDINTGSAGGSGIRALNLATTTSGVSTINVTAYGTIETGSAAADATYTSLPSAGILVGYLGSGYAGVNITNTPAIQTGVLGNITVDNYATITAGAGAGIEALNYGTGNITITDEAPTVVGATTLEIQAASGASLQYGIDAENYGSGNIAITTTAGDDINTGSAGGSGIRALNLATTTSGVSSSITVTAYGTIETGTAANDAVYGTLPAAGILAGYLGAGTGNTPTAQANVLAAVTVDNYATITSAAGDGIAALNYGTGTITVDNYASASVTGQVGLYAYSVGTDTITIDNKGGIYSNGSATDAAVLINQSASGVTTITNEHGATIANSSLSASDLAIASTGGGTVHIYNYGTIDGTMSIDATFDNELGGVWNVSGTNAFDGTSTITNDGTINVEGSVSFTSTGTLTITNNATFDIGTTASGTVLTLENTEIDTGTLVLGATGGFTGIVDVEKAPGTAVDDATLDGVTITDFATADGIEVGQTTNAVLLLDGGTAMNGGTLAIGAGSTLDVEIAGATSAAPDAILDGVIVTDDDITAYALGTSNAGIEVGVTSAATLLLDGGTVIDGSGSGTLAIGAGSTLDVEGASGATLDGVVVTDGGAIDISTATPAAASTLLLDDGTAISGGGTGTLTIGVDGTLDVERGPATIFAPDATLVGVDATNDGTIDVGVTGAATLLVDGGSMNGNGTIDVGATAIYTAIDDGVSAVPDTSSAIAIDGAGDVLGTYTDGSGNSHGFIYSGGNFTDVTDSSAVASTFVLGIANVAGTAEAVGYYINGSGLEQAFLFNGTSESDLSNDGLGVSGTVAYGINSSGLVVGDDFLSSTDEEGFVYDTATNSLVADGLNAGNANGAGTTLIAINDNGDVIGNYVDATTGLSTGAIGIYSGGGYAFTAITPFAGVNTTVTAIDNVDDVVGNFTDTSGYSHGFSYSATLGTYIAIDDPSAVRGTYVTAVINDSTADNEQVVGYYVDASGVDHAFLYSDGLYFNLTVTGATGNSVATGINSAGEIVGYYFDGTGEHAFLTTMPGVATLLLTDGTSVSGATIDNRAFDIVDINQGSATAPVLAATFDDVTVNNAGAIVLDPFAMLDVQGTTSIDGGTLAIGDLGSEIDVQSGADLTLDGVGVTSAGTLLVESATLNLDNTVIWSGTLQTTGTGVIEISGSGNISTLNGSALVGTGVEVPLMIAAGSDVQIDQGAQLELAGDIDNLGTINVGSAAHAAGLVIDGSVTLGDPSLAGAVTLNNSASTITDGANGAALTNDNAITGVGTIGSGDGKFTIVNNNVIGAVGGQLLLDLNNTAAATADIVNYGILEATGGGNLEIENTKVVNNTSFGGGVVTVDATSTLTLETNSRIAAGSIANNNLVVVTGAAELSGGTLTNTVTTPSTGTLQIDDGETLTLSTETISGGMINDYSSNTTPANGGSIDVIGASVINDGATLNDGSVTMNARLTLDGTSGAVTVNNTAFTTETGHSLAISGPVTINGSTITDGGHVNIGTAAIGATLTLDDGATVNGTAATGTGNGTLTVSAFSVLDIEAGAVNGKGATLDDVLATVTAGGSIAIGESSTVAATLLIDDGTKITGGTMSIGSDGGTDTLDVESAGGATLGGVGVTVSGSTSVIEIGQTSDSTLTLTGAASISGGTLTVGASGHTGLVDIESSSSANLEGVIVNDAALADGIEIAQTTNATLILSSGTSITDGTVTVGTATTNGTLDIENGTVTFDDVSVANSGTINVDPAAPATLVVEDDTTIAGSKLDVASNGILDVEAGSLNGDGATLDGVTVTVSGAGSIEVGASSSNATLTLDDDTLIVNGTIGLTANVGAVLDVEAGNSGSGAILENVDVTNTGATIEIGVSSPLSPAALTLVSGSTISGGQLTIGVNGALGAETSAGATLFGVSVTNSGIMEVVAGSKLVLNGQTTNGPEVVTNYTGSGLSLVNGIINIDSADISNGPALLDLVGASILGGIVDVGGTLDATGTSAITGAATAVTGTLEATGGTLTIDLGSLTNSGLLEVTSGATLVIDDSIIDGATAGSLEISGTGTLELGAGVVTDENVIFVGAGPGTLKLDSVFGASGFSGTVSGEAANDILDLNYSSASIDLTTGTLASFRTITLAGSTDTLTLGGNNIAVTVTGTGDTVILGGGTDTVTAGASAGNTTVTLGTGKDTVNFAAGSGGNTVNATTGTGATLIAGDKLTGAGTDTLVLTGGGSFNLNQLAVFTGFSTITLNGTSESLTLYAGENLSVNGGGSGDAVTLAVHSGTDTIDFTTGTNTVNAQLGTSGVATINATGTAATSDSLTGAGNDTLALTGSGSLNLNQLNAFTGFSTVTLNGSSENLTLYAGENLTVNGGGSGDSVTLAVHSGTDTIHFATGTNTVNSVIGTNATLNATGTAATSDSLTGAGNDTLALSGNGSLDLNQLNAFTGFSTITEDSSNIALTLKNGEALSVILGGGTDSVTGGTGAGSSATVTLGGGTDTATFSTGTNTVTLGAGADTVTFTGGTDTVDATALTLLSGDVLTGAGTSTLALSGGGTIDLNTPATLTGFSTVTEDGNNTTLTLRNGESFTATLGSGTDSITGGTGAGSNATVTLGSGTDTASFSTGTNTVTLGTGADTVTFTGGTNTVKATLGTLNALDSLTGDGSDTLALTGGGAFNLTGLAGGFSGFSSITLDNSGSTLTVNNSSLTVTGTSGGANTVTLTGGNDTVDLGGGTDLVVLGTGTDTVVFSGTGTHTVDAIATTLVTGDSLTGVGSDTLALSGGGSFDLTTLATFTGFSTVTLDATGSTLNVGNYSVTVNGTAGGTNSVTLGSGTDKVNLGNGTDTVTLGTGTATVTFSGTGSHTVDATALTLLAADKLTGTGTDTLSLSGGGSFNLNNLSIFTGFSTVSLDNSGSSLNVGSKSLTVNGTAGGSNAITLGTGTDTVNLGNAADTVATTDTVTLGTGTATVTFSGAGSHTVKATASTLKVADNLTGAGLGNDTLSLSGGGTFNLGSLASFSGFATVALDSSNSTLNVGNYSLTVNGGSAGNDMITLGSGTDTVDLGTGNDVVNLGIGTDTVAFTGTGTHTINATSLTLLSGDVLTGTGSTLALSGGGTINLNTPATLTGFSTVTEDSSSIALTLRNGESFTATLGSGTDTITGGTTAGSTATVILGSGTDTVNLSTGTNTVTLGAGQDTLNLTGGSNTVKATATTLNVLDTLTGDGTDTLALTGGGTINLAGLAGFSGFSTITLDNSGSNLTVNNSSLTVIGTSGANTVTLGSGADTVDLGNGTDVVVLGTGTDTVVFSGTGTHTVDATALTLLAGDNLTGTGSDTLALSGGGSFVSLASLGTFTGFSTVTLDAAGSTLNVGNYNLTVNGTTGGNNSVTLGTGTDTVKLGNGTDTVTLGTGTATVTLGGTGSHTVDATALTLLSGDKLTGDGSDTLSLSGGGSINLATPTTFTGISTITEDNSNTALTLKSGLSGLTIDLGTGTDSVVFTNKNESTPVSSDTISGFNPSGDQINLSQVTGATTYEGQISSGATIAAHSIAWYDNGGDTYVFVNTTNSAVAQSSAAMEIILVGSLTLSSGDFVVSSHPAGVADAPINLGLAAIDSDPSSVTVSISDIPAGWVINGGTENPDGSWTVTTNDVTSLTVTSPAGYSGATVLQLVETWTNPDGSTGTAIVADNVEAHAPGAPIFALAGDDHLTGAGANDLFVFAAPIGNDDIYNFNVASDKIDLAGFAHINSFSDLQGDISQDSSGDAVITLAPGETITLHGVSESSLTASDFVFNQTPVVENDGSMVVSDGAMMPLDGIIDNTGTIALNSTGDQTELQIVGNGITLQGGGQLTMSDSGANLIDGTTASTVLTNVDNTISGAGQIGTGDGNLTLVNEAHGTINANIAGGVLNLDTGSNVITNFGTLEASNGGELAVHSAVDNSGGTIEAVSGGHVDFLGAVTGGSATIAGGDLEFGAASNVSVTFNNATGYGELTLDDPSGFTGQINGFTGTAGDQAHSDSIDLAGINFDSSHFSEVFNTSTDVLTVSDGSDTVSLTLDNFDATLDFASDGNGGTLITDPPAATSHDSTAPVAWGMKFGRDRIEHSEHYSGGPARLEGPSAVVVSEHNGIDNFVFHPTLGGGTSVSNFEPAAFEPAESQNNHVSAPSTPETSFELPFDPAHHDANEIATQFHQIVASVTHLH